MYRFVIPSLVALHTGLLLPCFVAGQEQLPPAQVWQIKGSLAGLLDHYPEVAKRAVAKLAELLKNYSLPVKLEGELNTAVVTRLRSLLKDQDRDGYARLAAAKVLGRLGFKDAIPDLRDLLKNEKHVYVKCAAAEALVRLVGKQAVTELRNDKDPGIRIGVIQAQGRLDDFEALRELRTLLKSKDNHVQRAAVESLGILHDKESREDLRGLVKRPNRDMVRGAAVEALDRLGGEEPLIRMQLGDTDDDVWPTAADVLSRRKDKEAVALWRKTLVESPNKIQALKVLGRLRAGEAVEDIRKLLNEKDVKGRYFNERRYAVEALGWLDDKRVEKQLGDILKGSQRGYLGRGVGDDPDLTRSPTVLAFEHLEPTSILELLRLTYEISSDNPAALYDIRWLAHYWGGGQKQAEILCAYLGRPRVDPDPTVTREAGRDVLQALGDAWDESNSRSLQEDAASWIALIIIEEVKNWTADDVPTLKKHADRFQGKTRQLRVCGVGIKQVIARLEIWPPMWVQTVLAVVAVNLVAVLLMVFPPGRGGVEKWAPFLGFAGTGAGSWVADLTKAIHLEPWLLGGLLVAELGLLTVGGVFSPAVLRQIAKIEPLKRIAIPLALRLPWSRRRLFQNYVRGIRSRLDLSRDQARDEKYLPLPATIRSDRRSASLAEEPAAVVLLQLSAGVEQPGPVFVTAPGGRGKSALIREVVARALDEFEKDPARQPLPALLSGPGEAVKPLLEKALGPELVSEDLLQYHLDSGDFFLVLDGVTESGLPARAVGEFARSTGRNTPLLLGGRPSQAFEEVTRSSPRWMIVEPLPLDDAAPSSGGPSTLDRFVTNYRNAATAFPVQVKKACRGLEGHYVPLLVRMAVAVKNPVRQLTTMADVFFTFFLQLVDSQFPTDDPKREEKKLERLHQAARLCVETYWRDGQRQLDFDGKELQIALRQAGILLPDPREQHVQKVWFFHDLMQSYLTAKGLWRLLQGLNGEPPTLRPEDRWLRWTKEHVLLRAAADPQFTAASSDLIIREASELFQMCVLVVEEDLRPLFRAEVERWAGDYYRRMTEVQIEQMASADIRAHLDPQYTRTQLLRQAAQLCAAADAADGGQRLLTLYVNGARLVYPLERSKRDENAPPAGAA
jgi:HEAT repeat protein